MNELTIIEYCGEKAVDSREVAEMVDKQHKHLLADIRGYVLAISTQPNLRPSDFFIESVYQDSTGRTLPRFLITKKGCDMVANKLTGEKGVLFSAAYINKFHEMKAVQLPTDPLDLIIMQATAMKEIKSQVAKIEHRVLEIESQGITRQTDYYTIAGYANLRGIKVDLSKAGILGKKATKISTELGYDIGKTHDPRFGKVNTYHIEVLGEVLE